MKVLNNDRDETVRFRIEPRIGDDGIYLELKENGNRATTVFPRLMLMPYASQSSKRRGMCVTLGVTTTRT